MTAADTALSTAQADIAHAVSLRALDAAVTQQWGIIETAYRLQATNGGQFSVADASALEPAYRQLGLLTGDTAYTQEADALAAFIAATGPIVTKDLVPVAIRWDSDVTGGHTIFSCDVRNIGNTAVVTGSDPNAYGIGVLFTVDGVNVSWHNPVAGETVQPGQTVTFTANSGPSAVAYWTAGTVGQHTVVAFVDDVNRITDETDKTNNQLSTTMTVTAVPAPGGTTTVSPSAPVLGTPVTGFPTNVNDTVSMLFAGANPVAGDEVFVSYVIDQGTTVTPPAGWATPSTIPAQHTLNSYVFRKTWTGSEGTSQVFVLSNLVSSRSAIPIKVSGVDVTTPIAVTPVTAHALGASASAAIVNDVPHEMVLCFLMAIASDTGDLAFTTPATGYTELVDVMAGGHFRGQAVSYKDLVTNVGTQTVTSTVSGTGPYAWHEHLIVLNPSGGSTGGGSGGSGTTGQAYSTLGIKPGGDGPSGSTFRANFEASTFLNRKVGIMNNAGPASQPEAALSVTFGNNIFPLIPTSPTNSTKLAMASTLLANGTLANSSCQHIVQYLAINSGYPKFIWNYGWESDSYTGHVPSSGEITTWIANYRADVATFRAAELTVTGANQAKIAWVGISRKVSWWTDAQMQHVHDSIADVVDYWGFDHYDVAGSTVPAVSSTTGTWVDPAAAFQTNNQRDFDFWTAELARFPTKNLVIPEWGLWYGPYGGDTRVGGKDNPEFITITRRKFDALGARLVAHFYFCQDPDVPHDLFTNSSLFPASRARFLTEFK